MIYKLIYIYISFLLLLLNQYIYSQTPLNPGKPDTVIQDTTKFSCKSSEGSFFSNRKCPFNGEYTAAGGNVTITVLEMRNLPDTDGFGLAGLETDAYIHIEIPYEKRISDILKSDYIPNSLNPVWPPCKDRYCSGKDDILRDLNFGYRYAGTLMILNVFDADSGLEFKDDQLTDDGIGLRVIYCSQYTAVNQVTTNPGGDGLWEMSEQPVCVEEEWIPLDVTKTCFDEEGVATDHACVKLRQTVIPFQMNVEEVYLNDVTVNGGMAGAYGENKDRIYGHVYSGSDTRLAPGGTQPNMKGGMLIRLDSATLNSKGNSTLVKLYNMDYVPYTRFTINYDADMYVFRRKPDTEAYSLEWMDKKYGWIDEKDELYLEGASEAKSNLFVCKKKRIKANRRNQYGDSFGGGEIVGMNMNQKHNDNALQMYFIVVKPIQSTFYLEPQYDRNLDQTQFLNSLIQYGATMMILLWFNISYLKKMNWRIDRIETYLLSFTEHPDDIQDQENETTIETAEELLLNKKKPKKKRTSINTLFVYII